MRDEYIHSCHRDPNQECSFIPEISLVLLVQTATATTSVAVIGFAALEFCMRAIARFLVPAALISHWSLSVAQCAVGIRHQAWVVSMPGYSEQGICEYG